MLRAKRLVPALAGVALLTGLAGCSGGAATSDAEVDTSAEGETSSESAGTDDAQHVFMMLPNTTTVRFEERDAPSS